MSRTRTRAGGAAVLLALGGGLVLAGCGSDNPSSSGSAAPSIANCASGNINASGSTAQKNAIDTWVSNYQSACSGSTINYQAVGSGAGIQAFTQGSIAFAGSDSALKVPDEQNPANARCSGGQAINLPMVPGPIAVSYNLPGITNLVLDASDIANIFSGKVTNWNQVKTPQPAGVTLPWTWSQPILGSDHWSA